MLAGLDYHPDGIQACVLSARAERLANRRLPNNWQAVRDFTIRYTQLVATGRTGLGAADRQAGAGGPGAFG